MLSKLIKYELKRILKYSIPYYIIILISSILLRIFTSAQYTIFSDTIVQVLYVFFYASVANIIIYNSIRMFNFYKEYMYGNTSYLSHTLPVKTYKLHLNYVIIPIILLIINLFIIFIGLNIQYSNLYDGIKYIFNLDINIYSLITLILFEFLFIIYVGYLAINIGHRKINNKTLFSLIYGFIIYIVLQLILLLIFYLYTFINPDYSLIFTSSEFPGFNIINKLLFIGIIVYGIYLVLVNIISRYILNKGVNIE